MTAIPITAVRIIHPGRTAGLQTGSESAWSRTPPEQQAVIDKLNEELAQNKIPERDGLLLNPAYLMKYPHEKRLKLWKTEYIAARRIMRCKGKHASKDEYDRMTYAAMMWKREECIGQTLPQYEEMYRSQKHGTEAT